MIIIDTYEYVAGINVKTRTLNISIKKKTTEKNKMLGRLERWRVAIIKNQTIVHLPLADEVQTGVLPTQGSYRA